MCHVYLLMTFCTDTELPAARLMQEYFIQPVNGVSDSNHYKAGNANQSLQCTRALNIEPSCWILTHGDVFIEQLKPCNNTDNISGNITSFRLGKWWARKRECDEERNKRGCVVCLFHFSWPWGQAEKKTTPFLPSGEPYLWVPEWRCLVRGN